MKKNFIKKILNCLTNILSCKDKNYIAYLCGNDALPTPLDEEEECILIDEISKGNESAKQKLIEHNMRLVVYIAKKFDNCNIELEDLISVGSIGLIKAINTYTSDKNIKLATYASRCIENEILMQIRKSQKRKNELSFDEPINFSSNDGELVLGDLLYQDADIVSKDIEDEVEKEVLMKCLRSLSDKEKKIMEMRFGLGGEKEKTQKELADSLGISQSYISRIEKKILVKLKKEMLSVV